MTANEDYLREKAKLLIARERELLAIKRKHKRLGLWLALAQRLPQLVDPKVDLPEVCAAVADQIVSVLDLHRVGFFVIEGTRLRPLGQSKSGDDGATELGAAAAALIEGDGAGVCLESAGDAQRSLSQAVGLHRFLWQRLTPAGAPPLLFVAGYDRERSQFFAAFDEDDLAHFANTAHQLTLLLGNNNLVRALEREKGALSRFNVELERQVRERTRELAATNGELEQALSKLQERDRRLQKDIEEACLFQQKILPELPVSAPVDFAAAYMPLERVGGDLFDVVMLEPRRFRVFVADATGHGVQAAMRTILIKTEFDRVKSWRSAPHRILQELSARLVAHFPGGETMCTACCVDIALDEQGGARVTYANAGSAPLYHWSNDGIKDIYGETPFLGVGNPTWPEPLVFRMMPGEVLLVATDGLTEQRDSGGAVFEDRIKTIRFDSTASATDFVGGLVRGWDAFRGGLPPADDVTLVASRLPPAPLDH